MHMADALISPAVGGGMWATTAGLLAYSARRVRTELDDKKIPMMGVLGAFIFAAQMINFSIPITGSSGHLGGGLILAILLGPYAGFLAMASVLVIQALFFADGGILALGCNIFNMGFWTCFLTYPLIYKTIVRDHATQRRIIIGAMTAAVVGLQLGAFSVVLETLFSGRAALPFRAFSLLMQPIHLAIGIVEGLITAAVVSFVWKARPEIIHHTALAQPIGKVSIKNVLMGLVIAAAVTGGVLSWFASTHPDGLEWSVFHTMGQEEPKATDEIHQLLANVQKKTTFLPEYDFPKSPQGEKYSKSGKSGWPVPKGGTSMAGIVGAALTMVIAVFIGFGLSFFKKKQKHG